MLNIAIATTDDQIAATYEVMAQLRPHIARADYVPVVKRLMTGGYKLVALADEGRVRAVAGFRLFEMLYCGRLMYVDDLVTDENARSRGYGHALLGWLKAEARHHECSELQLISHVRREQAHRFYFREGLGVEAFHFRAKL